MIFNEDMYYYKGNKRVIRIEENEEGETCENREVDDKNGERLENNNPQNEPDEHINKERDKEINMPSNSNDDPNKIINKESKRKINMPSKFNDYEMYMAFDAISFVEQAPVSYNELYDREDKDLWEKAMNREIESINKNNTWKLIEEPKNVEVLDTRWVYTYKPLERDLINTRLG